MYIPHLLSLYRKLWTLVFPLFLWENLRYGPRTRLIRGIYLYIFIYMEGQSGRKWSNLVGSLSGRRESCSPDWLYGPIFLHQKLFSAIIINIICPVREIGGYWSHTFLCFYGSSQNKHKTRTQPTSPYLDLMLSQ
jgi:hypothetical protein